MTFWLVAGLILLLGGLAPAVYLAGRGTALERMVGLQFAGAALVPILLLLAVGFGQPSYLTVPLVLAVLSFAGVLVFVRLFGAAR